MDNVHTLQRLQGQLNEEMHRLTQLRDVFQAQHCADELDAASHLEAAHIAHCSARRRSLRRILLTPQENSHRQARRVNYARQETEPARRAPFAHALAQAQENSHARQC